MMKIIFIDSSENRELSSIISLVIYFDVSPSPLTIFLRKVFFWDLEFGVDIQLNSAVVYAGEFTLVLYKILSLFFFDDFFDMNAVFMIFFNDVFFYLCLIRETSPDFTPLTLWVEIFSLFLDPNLID